MLPSVGGWLVDVKDVGSVLRASDGIHWWHGPFYRSILSLGSEGSEALEGGITI
jgi:hypothetical protein